MDKARVWKKDSKPLRLATKKENEKMKAEKWQAKLPHMVSIASLEKV